MDKEFLFELVGAALIGLTFGCLYSWVVHQLLLGDF